MCTQVEFELPDFIKLLQGNSVRFDQFADQKVRASCVCFFSRLSRIHGDLRVVWLSLFASRC